MVVRSKNKNKKIPQRNHTVLRKISLSKYQTAVNAIFRHSSLFDTLPEKLKQKFIAYNNVDSYLKASDTHQLAPFLNQTICMQYPLFSSALRGAYTLKKAKENKKQLAVNTIALAISALAKAINCLLSAVTHQLSSIIFHTSMNYRHY